MCVRRWLSVWMTTFHVVVCMCACLRRQTVVSGHRDWMKSEADEESDKIRGVRHARYNNWSR